jgi:serine/threonine protein kinase
VSSQGDGTQAEQGSAGHAVGSSYRRPFVPEPFGKYYLLDRVAVGGMAEVFRAKSFGHSGFEKVVVIKKILDRFAEDPDFVEMFIDEAKLSVQLMHPNIAQIYDFGKILANYFISMEAVDGKDLKSLLRRLAERGERMPIEFACYIGHQAARGLDYAHKRSDQMGLPLNIVHRDVSPSNILLSYDGHVKILDFGIAHADSGSRESEAGVLKGKYSYMSPEQASGLMMDHRSDVFSAGICLWECLTGNRLFRRSTDIETLEAIKACQIPLPSEYNPAVPPELDEICLVALGRDPEIRYADAGVLQHALGDFMLPHIPDRLTPEVASFMRERFGEEILQERERLERGTRLAQDMHYGGEVDLDLDETILEDVQEDEDDDLAATTETVRPVTSAEPPTANRTIVAAIGLVAALFVVLAVLAWPLLFGGTGEATLEVELLPEGIEDASMTVDGVPVEGLTAVLTPDVPHDVVISAPGWQPRTKQIELVPGQSYAIEVQLQPEQLEDLPGQPLAFEELLEEATPAPIEVTPAPRAPPEERPTPTPRAAPTVERAPADLPVGDGVPSRIWFSSDPAGAAVWLDGRRIGTTPFEWTGADPGRVYEVEFTRTDRQLVKATVTGPQAGGSVTVKRDLPTAVNASAGKLNVQATPGWAKVYIDGAYVSTTPLIGHELPAGSYAIRLVNDRLGTDINDQITIEAGETTIRAYQLDR